MAFGTNRGYEARIYVLRALKALLLLSVMITPPAFAQRNAAEDQPGKEQLVPKMNRLPEPLDEIVGNVTDFERDGLFKVTGVRLGPAGLKHDPAVVWTLRANRSMTLRRAEIFLRDFRDVRFYRFGRNEGRPAFTTLLFYSNRISEGAVDDGILPKGISVEAWIPLDRVGRLKLIGAKIDTMIMRPSKQRKL